MARITEKELIIPALSIMNKTEGGTVSTTDLINQLTEDLKPTGEDLDILENRSDTKFSQKVRNLKSHNSFTDLAKYTPPTSKKESGTFTILEQGKLYLKNKGI